ncbi:MAG: LVIVD repeat-containing protein [Gemmatimonadaceae bacterium]
MRRTPLRQLGALGAVLLFALGAACGGDDSSGATEPINTAGCPAAGGATPSNAMTVLGCGNFKPARTTAEIAVRGTLAYTTTWGNPSGAGSAFYIWDVSGNTPTLIDSVKVDNARTLGDIALSDDGGYLIVATEAGGSLAIYSLTNPRQPVLLTRYTSAEISPGVHTAEVGRVNGKLYGFLSIDPGASPAKLVIVDLGNPAAPQQVFSQFIGTPYVHDTFVRDGILFLALWNAGVAIWDIGGGGKGGTPSNPVEIGRLQTANGEVHNIWWFKDSATGSAKYAFIGEEGPGNIGVSSLGDIHVVDVSNMASPREVAFYTVPGVPTSGTHNFSMDEPNGILYAAYYNGGVRALDVRGDLGTCTAAEKSTPSNQTVALCDLTRMGRERAVGLKDRSEPVYVWGVQFLGGSVYASDMLNGIWKLRAVSR